MLVEGRTETISSRKKICLLVTCGLDTAERFAAAYSITGLLLKQTVW